MKTVGEGFSSVENKLSLGVTAPLVSAGTAATNHVKLLFIFKNFFKINKHTYNMCVYLNYFSI